MALENHPIINGFVPKGTTKLIVGTFPPKNEYKSKRTDFFYYSSVKNHFWNRIDNVNKKGVKLKQTKYKNESETISANKSRKENFSRENKLGFIDIFSKVKRKKNTSSNSDLIAIETILQNKSFLGIVKSVSTP